jgi:hypothetical protein
MDQEKLARTFECIQVKDLKKMYFEIERANQIKESYSSWIARKAYAGEGKMDVLKAIVVKPKRKYLPSRLNLYKVEFHFENGSKLPAPDFFAYNGISMLGSQNQGKDNLKTDGLQSSPSM